MQTREKYTDRRSNQRRQDRNSDPIFEKLTPSQSRRHGDRRCNPRRRNERLNLSFEISLSDQDVRTINVSSSGVYFEVAIQDMETFSPGTTIPLQINTVTDTSEYRERKRKLSGRGTVIRNCIIENLDLDSSLGVALELTETLNNVLNSN
ncbi:MAG: hypothetical protein ACC651_09245 [Candidatus Scalindua sp.]